jgi:hypothetical protein
MPKAGCEGNSHEAGGEDELTSNGQLQSRGRGLFWRQRPGGGGTTENRAGEKAKVKLVAPRPKGGFDVQDIEPGRNPGTLTLGTPPPGIDTNPLAVVNVLVHVDEPKRPQYKWPQLPKK